MSRKYIVTILALVSVLIMSCRHKTVFKEVQSPDKCTIQLPEYMHATTDLFHEGKYCLQYENDSMQVYMLMFDTARQNLREGTLQQYYDSIVSDPMVPGAQIAAPKLVTVDHDSALQTVMMAELNNVPVFYKIEMIATPLRFYYILLWCRKDKKDDLKSDFEKVLGSFHDINRSKV